ncbi:hypothetical protein [Tenacibaculum geojense]|uniref:Uncharacterized protein n=1 Tax=Tenacibaculum geojense TaxID=915352 RepID=A0ABW3JU40_9FLAO
MDETLLSEKKYFEYIKNLELPLKAIEMMEILINEKDENKRVIIWSNLSNCLDEKELKLLANPFYIGFGNPNSDFLFLGQEKAFDPKANKELLLLESINNNYYWDIVMNTKKKPNIFNTPNHYELQVSC